MKLSDFDFRIWNNNSKTYEARSIIESLGFITSIFNQLTYEKPTINYEIELFIGLYDKAGVKIFAGDILNFRGKNYLAKMNKKLKTIIICESKDSVYIMHISKGNLIKECKVIGNIHENEEILKNTELLK
ncbi:YopX family protein [Campylobacter coli]|uniref:YopX family protein n=1 Tax=Campylobacter coli TaxID=195 RepID=UPI0030C4D0CF